ncbi:hypothetical protein H2203_001732 [Taxawa tesnikishii (nom. ined.)]|nr:hypothetical protein H2203_001732 [Dothideales sp. JES 119]
MQAIFSTALIALGLSSTVYAQSCSPSTVTVTSVDIVSSFVTAPGPISTIYSVFNVLETTEVTTTTYTHAKTTSVVAHAPLRRDRRDASDSSCDTVTKTVTVTGQVVLTTTPVSTWLTTATSTVTATKTLSLAAPSFTKVFGPQDGCIDVAVRANFALNSTVGQKDAIATCKAQCAQLGSCDFVYVQWMMQDYGTVTPFWECYL